MTKEFDPAKLRLSALSIVDDLERVATERKRIYPPDIQAVLCVSGYGLYNKPLKSEKEPHAGHYQGRDRIRAAAAVVREITRSRIEKLTGERPLSIDDAMIRECGPLLVYNGTPDENADFRRVANSRFTNMPSENILVIDNVLTPEGVVNIVHTGHQFTSLFQQIDNPESPLHGITNLAVVSSPQQFARIPYYLKLHHEDRLQVGKKPIKIWAYSVRGRKGSHDLIEGELNRLVTYAKNGQLADSPIEMVM